MSKSPANVCPFCKLSHTVKPHCPSPTCSWVKCDSCRVVLDLAAGRGWDADHKPIVLKR